MIDLYNLRTTRKGWRMTKFDQAINPVEGSSYEMHYVDSVLHCSCPAMARSTCRHREMFPHFVGEDRIDGTWFLEFNPTREPSHSWRQYVGPFDGDDDPIINTELPKATFVDADSPEGRAIAAAGIDALFNAPKYMGVPIIQVEEGAIIAEASSSEEQSGPHSSAPSTPEPVTAPLPPGSGERIRRRV